MKIFLIGMMGSGKSSVGEKLSEYIDIPFFDTDNILVDNEGISIKEIFKNWDILKNKSFMIGDKISDKKCAEKSDLYFEFAKDNFYNQTRSIVKKI